VSSSAHDEVVPTRLILVRHGESEVTVRRVIGGPRSCTGLSPLGVQQAERLRDRLAETGELAAATALFASEYPRAVETAEIIAPTLGLPVERDVRFGEHDSRDPLGGCDVEARTQRAPVVTRDVRILGQGE